MGCETRETYLKQVAKNLELPRRLRRELLKGLRQELEDGGPLREELEPPEEMAELLATSVPLEVRTWYRSRKKWRIRGTIATILLVFVLVTGYLIYLEKSQVVRAKSTITITDIIIE